MQSDLNHLAQTWETPDKELVFQGYTKIPFPLKTILVLATPAALLHFLNKIGLTAARFSFMKHLDLFTVVSFTLILYLAFRWLKKQHQHRFFKNLSTLLEAFVVAFSQYLPKFISKIV